MLKPTEGELLEPGLKEIILAKYEVVDIHFWLQFIS